MSHLRRLALLPILALVPLAAAVSPARAALPQTVTVHDTTTSAAIVDITTVRLEASWYWDSEQLVSVTVPGGFKAGHRLTVWFDLNGDNTPDGHFNLQLSKGAKYLKKVQGFRRGGGWTLGGKQSRCSDSEGFAPVSADVKSGQKTISLGLDLWDCLGVRKPSLTGTAFGSWRTAVSVVMGKQEDDAPNHHGWSPAVAGWGPCDPSGGSCS